MATYDDDQLKFLTGQLAAAQWNGDNMGGDSGYGTLARTLMDSGVTDLSQLKWRDATVNTDDMSKQDVADAGYNRSLLGGAPSAGNSGFFTPSGQLISAGDFARDGHTVYSITNSANGAPVFSSHQDTPDLGLKDLALMAAMTIGGAFGMQALGALGGVGGAAAGAAEGGAAAALGGATEGGAAAAASGGVEGAAAGGSFLGDATAAGYDPLFGAAGDLEGGGAGTYLGDATAAGYDPGAFGGDTFLGEGQGTGMDFSQGFTDTGTAGGAADTSYAGSAAVTGANGASPVLDATDANYQNGADMQSDANVPDNTNYDYRNGADIESDNFDGNVGDATAYDYRNGADIESDAVAEGGVPSGPWGPSGIGDVPGSDAVDYRNGSDIASDNYTADHYFDNPGANIEPSGGGAGGPGGGGGGPGADGLPFDWDKFLKSFLDGIKGLLGGGGADMPGGGGGPSFVPPQPVVGAGDFTSAMAQGGASGSLEGVAGTLLTSKDTFGFGRTTAG
jgi:hypothetical protein